MLKSCCDKNKHFLPIFVTEGSKNKPIPDLSKWRDTLNVNMILWGRRQSSDIDTIASQENVVFDI